MITATTLRRVGQLNAENAALRKRLEELKAERDYLSRRLADFHYLNLSYQSNQSNEEQTK